MTNRGTEMALATTFVVEDCITCGTLFAMTADLVARRRKDHKAFYCPNGHNMYFADKNKEELALERAQNAERRLEAERRYAAQLREQNEAERRSHAATKGQLTKTRKRIEKGICTQCNRHFTNVERHMASQHPETAPALRVVGS